MIDPRYPIGKYEQHPYSESQKLKWLNNIRQLPTELEYAIQDLDAVHLQSPYREGGWTIQQLVHHVADSHINAYVRFKLALTEDNVTVKSYEEQLWAELADVQAVPVNISITLLHALHTRMYAAIKDLSHEQWNRTLHYPGKAGSRDHLVFTRYVQLARETPYADILSYREAHNI